VKILLSDFTKRLKEIDSELVTSARWYRILANYCRCLSQDFFMIDSSLNHGCSAIGRIQVDSWLCEIERQQHTNSKLKSITAKMALLGAENCLNDSMNTYIAQLSELDASINDGYLQGKSNRPIDGLIPCQIPNEMEGEINAIEIYCSQTPGNWEEWGGRIRKHLAVVNNLVKLFPAAHPFASIPCSISILLNRTLQVIQEQRRLEKTLEILTRSDGKGDYSTIFGLDVLLIRDRLCPIPILAGEE